MWLTYALGVTEGAAHLPVDTGGSRILAARRWVEQGLAPGAAADAPRQLLLCDAASRLHLGTSGAGRVWAGVQLGDRAALAPVEAQGLLLNQMDIDAAHEDEFNDWYDTEHLPRIAAVDGVIAARRFRSDADTPRYLATYHLRDLDVVRGAAWKAAASTPWTARMRRHRTGLIRIGFVPA
ncbi:DUF4286 family protein [Hephaestia sp. GCM10023244]|uniref:DUF4286 family protein n=1 Tax=unclassified Hephaestia TaxID=2631281 RepID=UPI0020770A49|nr:DUF4286 family protein [Hephaestia sp. MAHUQ-44]MCM8732032.1 hypothetical protein [Hephaestia sp. MAHUQ-44]